MMNRVDCKQIYLIDATGNSNDGSKPFHLVFIDQSANGVHLAGNDGVVMRKGRGGALNLVEEMLALLDVAASDDIKLGRIINSSDDAPKCILQFRTHN